jgi:drug/metabolite transporter (DMT)-like permease
MFLHGKKINIKQHYLSTSGVFFALVAFFLGASCSALIKSATTFLPYIQIVFVRYALGALIAFVFLGAKDKSGLMSLRHGMLHFQRAVLGMGAFISFVVSLHYTPLSVWTALSFTNPLMLAVLAAIILKERVSALRWLAILLGFSGVLIIVEPHETAGYLPIVLLILGCLSAALSDIAVRKLSSSYSSAVIVFIFFTICSILLLPVVPFFWRTPNFIELILLISIALCGLGSQLCLTKAIQTTSASSVAPFAYTSLLWTTVFGYLFWNELPTLKESAGILLIVADGILAYITIRKSSKVTQSAHI